MASLFDNENTKNSESKDVSIHDEANYTPVVEHLNIAGKLKEEIDAYCVKAYVEPFRWHLGASIIGHSCKRFLWYHFRWVKPQTMQGWQARIADRGNREEARFIEWLRGIGCQLWALDENGKQYRFSAVMGHYGGSIDSVIQLPEAYKFDRPMLASYKTNNTGKGFNELLANGMQKAKPQHWAQECAYGYHMNIEYVAYFNINKNDDSLHVETLKLDSRVGKQMEDKAEIVIRSQTAPPRLSDNPNHFECSFCNYKDICHGTEAIAQNCRSCKNASPVEGGEWFCSLPAHNSQIPRDFVKSCAPCPANAYIPITEVK